MGDGSVERLVLISVPTGMCSLLFFVFFPAAMGEMTAGLDNLSINHFFFIYKMVSASPCFYYLLLFLCAPSYWRELGIMDARWYGHGCLAVCTRMVLYRQIREKCGRQLSQWQLGVQKEEDHPLPLALTPTGTVVMCLWSSLSFFHLYLVAFKMPFLNNIIKDKRKSHTHTHTYIHMLCLLLTLIS